jgi:hypothetical protein
MLAGRDRYSSAAWHIVAIPIGTLLYAIFAYLSKIAVPPSNTPLQGAPWASTSGALWQILAAQENMTREPTKFVRPSSTAHLMRQDNLSKKLELG